MEQHAGQGEPTRRSDDASDRRRPIAARRRGLTVMFVIALAAAALEAPGCSASSPAPTPDSSAADGREKKTEDDPTTCSDGKDNDGDSLVDCADRGCHFFPHCQQGDASASRLSPPLPAISSTSGGLHPAVRQRTLLVSPELEPDVPSVRGASGNLDSPGDRVRRPLGGAT